MIFSPVEWHHGWNMVQCAGLVSGFGSFQASRLDFCCVSTELCGLLGLEVSGRRNPKGNRRLAWNGPLVDLQSHRSRETRPWLGQKMKVVFGLEVLLGESGTICFILSSRFRFQVPWFALAVGLQLARVGWQLWSTPWKPKNWSSTLGCTTSLGFLICWISGGFQGHELRLGVVMSNCWCPNWASSTAGIWGKMCMHVDSHTHIIYIYTYTYTYIHIHIYIYI